jgi:dCMP deaminase
MAVKKRIKKLRREQLRKRPDWDESFMFSAIWAASRSSCLHFHTGAVIVRDKRKIAEGYNGAPPNSDNCRTRGCRKDEYGVDFDDKGKGVCRGLHAEVNAMNQISRNDLQGTTLYTLFYPCSACAKQIVGNGIAEVVFSEIYREPDSLTRELFAEAGVKLRQYCVNLPQDFKMIRDVANQPHINRNRKR